jgi:DNA-binding NarL/FixJ family response regulator
MKAVLVQSNPGIVDTLKKQLALAGFDAIFCVDDPMKMWDHVQGDGVNVVVFSLPQALDLASRSVYETIKQLRRQIPEVYSVCVAYDPDDAKGILAKQKGAHDFLGIDWSPDWPDYLYRILRQYHRRLRP